MIGVLVKALLAFLALGLLMRGARAVLSSGHSGSPRGTDHDRSRRRPSGAAPGGGTPTTGKPPVRREDIIDVPYDES